MVGSVKAIPAQVVGLDLLRLAAALVVTIYHLTYLEWANPHAHGTYEAELFRAYVSWTPYVDTGWVGVQIFFVISGFVIAYTANGRSPSAFLRGRILRLVPGIWICATMSVAALLAAGVPVLETIRLYAFSLILFPVGPWVASSYWTLPLEIVFYAVIFLVLSRDRFDRVEGVVLALGGMSLAAWAGVLVATFSPGPVGDAVITVVAARLAKLILLQHGCFFAIGAMIWIIRERGGSVSRYAAIAAFIVAGLIQIDMEAYNASAWAGVPMSAFPAIAAFIGSLAFIAASLHWNEAVHRQLGSRAAAVRTLGLMTYPVYLLHQPFGILASLWQLKAGVDPALALTASILLVMVLAWLVAVGLEPVTRSWMKPWLDVIDRRLVNQWTWASRTTRRLPAESDPVAVVLRS